MEHETPEARTVHPLALTSAAPVGPDSVLQALVKAGSLHTLTLDQKRFLAALIEHGTPSLAHQHDCRNITPRQHAGWIRSNPIYAEAVKAIGDGLLLEAQAKMLTLTNRAADTFEEALEADQIVTCPACEHHFAVTDLKFRTKVAADILKASVLSPKLRFEGEVKHREMGLEDRIALAQLARGDSVSPTVISDLQRRGLLPEDFLQRFNATNPTIIDHEPAPVPALPAP